MKHPAEFFIKALIIQSRGPLSPNEITDAEILRNLDTHGFLAADLNYLGLLRSSIPTHPANFDPNDRLNRPSVKYLRDNGVYEFFHQSPEMEEARSILTNFRIRQVCEQILLAWCANKTIIQKVNRRYDSHLTEDGIKLFSHYFWNVGIMDLDSWGRYLYDRSAMYPDYIALLRATPEMLLFKLRIEQQLESKKMVKRAQDISYFNLEQVNLIPGTDSAKVKAIGVLTKAVIDCDTALSASDAQLGSVLKEFEKFRTDHPHLPAPDIKQLATENNFSGSGSLVNKVKAPQ